MSGWIDVGASYFGEDEGEKWKRRGPCKNESYKVLNFDFYSIFLLNSG